MDTDSEIFQRCIALIERHAPKLMRAGGGGLAMEFKNPAHALPRERKRAVQLYEQNLDLNTIAAKTGRSYDWVRRQVIAAGYNIKLRSLQVKPNSHDVYKGNDVSAETPAQR